MDDTMNNVPEEELDLTVESASEVEPSNTEDPFKEAVEAQLKKIQRQNLLIGAQTICSVILEKITTAMNQPGKRTMNDYKRLVKDVESFCRTGLSRKVNADGETEPVEETVQN